MYKAKSNRYENMEYNRVGTSGLKLPAISLGLWHNFGDVDSLEDARDIIFRAFDLGITHFDLANNYGPPPGSAEANFGKILKRHLKHYRDEMIISSKAGYEMWDGPYGDGGSRKYLIASLDQSLKRLGLDYVDIFYSHRFDPNTPLEETMRALDHIVRSGRALYVGISNYNADQTSTATEILQELGTPFIIHQHKYNMFYRELEKGTDKIIKAENLGTIVFSPLAQGLLTSKYLDGIPEKSRVNSNSAFLNEKDINGGYLAKAQKLNQIAQDRSQTLAQMALAWVLNNPVVTSALVGASSPQQIEENVATLDNPHFSGDEINKIDKILNSK
ncbi:MAG: aldo/keto reductase [Candidatus Marinimicrobia bacterium]|nr:aldo/keto reductase [Candidatus Neomarinimicrobiota bacterium]